MNQTVHSILRRWLGEHGYDGLVSANRDCGCRLEDLTPCQTPCDNCQPGYRGPDPTGEGDWLMYPTRRAAIAAAKAAKEKP